LFYEKKKYININIAEELLLLLCQSHLESEGDSALWEVRKACFDSMSRESREIAIKNHYLSSCDNNSNPTDKISPEEKVKRLISNIENIPSFALKEIWGTQKEIIFNNSAPRYSVYQANGHDNVYAIDILTKKRIEKEWISALYKFARMLNPQATHINLLIHQGDIVEEHDYINYTYIFSQEELNTILGDTNGVTVNVFAYSHTSESPIYLVLRNAFDFLDGNIPDEIDSVHRKISYIVNDYWDFRKRLSNTINAIKKGNDPIGNAYPIPNKKI
jgi:hypothetical protein